MTDRSKATVKPNRKSRRLQFIISVAIALVLTLAVSSALRLRDAATGNVDAFLVLGGSIQREIHVARLATQYPDIPILISKGSDDPCILLIFDRERAEIDNVWLENCANSTFGNFYFTQPILQQWGVRRLKLITSPTHLPRAKWLAQIILGSHGIWVETDLVDETGVPGNRESLPKTLVDTLRGLVWAGISQVYAPTCNDLKPLSAVNLDEWR
ncbi:MAG: YdcF family protein, partial [Cyanobacteriota bacterium]|nr:YdcF family protein [Cyanobacteriota bacterium]